MTRPGWHVGTQAFLRAVARLLFGVRVSGTSNVPMQGGCLLASNHESYLDPPLIGSFSPRPLHYFAKRQLFEMPGLSHFIRLYGAIPIDRGGFDRRGLNLALEVLARGEALLVFPEGTRIRRPGFGPPREGVGLLALRSGVPVIPVWIGSSWEPRRRLWRRIPIQIRFGAPLRFLPDPDPAPAGRRARYAEVAAAVMSAIAALAGESQPGIGTDAGARGGPDGDVSLL